MIAMRILNSHQPIKDRRRKPSGILLLTLCLVITCPLVTSQDGFTKNILFSNRHLEIFILCRDTASFDQTDWLQLGIRNRTDQDVFIQDVHYSLNNPLKSPTGEKIPNMGALGTGNRYDVFHVYDELDNPSDHFRDGVVIDAHTTLMSWKHMSDYAVVNLEPFVDRIEPSRQVCTEIKLSISYRREKKVTELNISDRRFCFYWNAINTSTESLLLKRLQYAMHSSNRTANSYVIHRLMKEERLRQLILTSEFIDVICKDKKGRGEYVNIIYLEELERRSALPNPQLTLHYTQQLRSQYFPDGELLRYWDDRLFDEILESNSYLGNVANLLERTSVHWKNDHTKRRKIYHYLQFKTKFDRFVLPVQEDFKDWSHTHKLMSLSRDTSLIPYFVMLLNNETAFDYADWSKYRHRGFISSSEKPDTISVRVCDIAFICLLRLLDQTEIEQHGLSGIRIRQDLIPMDERIIIPPLYSRFHPELTHTEKYFRLTPGIKAALLAHIEQID